MASCLREFFLEDFPDGEDLATRPLETTEEHSISIEHPREAAVREHDIPSRAPAGFFGVLGLLGLLRVEVTLSCVPLLTCSWRILACFLTGRRRFSMVS